MSSISASEISKLDDKSKKDMLDFIEGENSKQKIQMAKCVNNVEANDLTSNEEQCLANCVNRFLDVNIRVINGLQNSASQ
ncbi:Mitochondrial import inner membrane translocase subunit tim8 [Monosporozyma unispora]|nr:Mitochondrial import inner membrane translocase subunit tim8 [Kazachstania unispora]